MKAPFSSYLTAIAPGLSKLVALAGEIYDYASVLSSDSRGFALRVSPHVTSVSSETMTTERGSVLRVCRDGLYSEYSFNEFDPLHPEKTMEAARRVLDAQLSLLKETGSAVYATGLPQDEPETLLCEMETGRLPEQEDLSALADRLRALADEGMRAPHMTDCTVTAQSTHICKLFLTRNRDLRQSYVYSEGSVLTVVCDGRSEQGYAGISGRKGPELFEGLPDTLTESLGIAHDLLGSEPVEPGEYDIIADPEVSGLIAHEAFGHGVEMDMFVKDRALGRDYIGKRVGSDRVTMHEGALCDVNVTSYAFDDEGVPAGDVTEIEHGILKTGICDTLAALRLHTCPTGNGKRENFEHKAYTRMTNTIFDSGTDSLEEMIRSISHGYLLRGCESGMEDPKHWGIQCIVQRGYEIRDGKLTGKVIAPVVLTGYVPDLLGSISMVSPERAVFGTGGCGKGWKEWVKVADGGPYLKARARLG